jgi:hypothetical protein
MADHPKFEDFGDMMLTGDGGAGYVRVDWFTPDGLPTWGDGRLFILGTEGYIELRKYVDIAGAARRQPSADRDKKGVRGISTVRRSAAVRAAVRHRHRRAHQRGAGPGQALLAAELVLTAQKNATKPSLA